MFIRFFRFVTVATIVLFQPLVCMEIRVDTTNPISIDEVAYNNSRHEYSNISLQAFLGPEISIKYFPNISCCLSGGGYRAMISSAAFLHALEDIGLLGAVKHMACLSGSAWGLGHLMIRNSVSTQPMSMQEFCATLKQNVVNKSFFDPKSIDWRLIFDRIYDIYIETHSIQPADIWGALLVDRLMPDLCAKDFSAQSITFDKIRTFLGGCKKYPFPIFTASIDDVLPYLWLEVNPFVSGGDCLLTTSSWGSYTGAYIPTFALGSCFDNGGCSKILSEKSVGSLMGIFGSPYSLSMEDILVFAGQELDNYLSDKIPNYSERMILENLITEFIQHFCAKYDCNSPRFLPTHINNFLYKFLSILENLPQFTTADAGFATNLPVLPLLKKDRGVDIILICDASSDSDWKDSPEIIRARDLAIAHGLKFPSLANSTVINENLIVYQDPDPSIPIVVYFVNSINESTLKFDYTEDEFDQLYGFMYNAVKNNKNLLQSIILKKIEQKSMSDDFVIIGPENSGEIGQGSVINRSTTNNSGYGWCIIL
jgi:phospholipase A2